MAHQAVVRTAIVGRRSLVVEGLVATMAASRFSLVLRCDSYVEFRYHAPSSVLDLSLFVVPTLDIRPHLPEIASMRAGHPDLCIVVLSSAVEDTAAVVAAGADGHLSTSASPEALTMALDFFVEGAGSRRSAASRWHSAPAGNARVEEEGAFSVREMTIIAAIKRGESNKLVARRLSMAEPTVKADVRRIMKKIGATNRTQIAVWDSRQHSEAPRRPSASAARSDSAASVTFDDG